MITVKDKVSMMFGKEVADTLDAEGLLAQSLNGKYPITGWRVHVKDTGNVVLPLTTASTPRVPRNLGNCLAAPLWKYQYNNYKDDLMEASQDFGSLGTARKQAKMAQNVGLETRIMRLSLIETGPEE